ncbi:hypothetical protein SUGI_0148510 [Cryptomeria japonica]|uniref:uncharacterized protein LOC131065247 n=1 Tax=Cryptomeria japonica TaxID=3369 RepID=UPI002408BA66|nr:uncharacterized protein LOC131065247 [Cryptomeria japonica]GLJ11245.1 hypothetical protein SUGI_0148510 [Cryptomeria japonica]
MHKIWESSEMDYSWLRILLIGGGCVGIGYILGRKPLNFRAIIKRGVTRKSTLNASPPSYDGKTDLHEIEQVAEFMEDFKMVLVVRNDLKMGKGKIAAQCSHATLGLYKKLFYRAPKALQRWEMCGQVKVVTRVDSEEELLLLQNRAKTLKLPTHITIDAGKTQIAPNSRTVMAILGPCDIVDEVTGDLKLL